MKYRFYDPAMHGVNWAAAKETYEPLLADLADTEELHNRGDGDDRRAECLAHRHSPAAMTSSQAEESDWSLATRVSTWSPTKWHRATMQVSYIYQKGPADHDYVKLKVGNFVLAVNGRELEDGRQPLAAFSISCPAGNSSSP